jgi:hypothetical protein
VFDFGLNQPKKIIAKAMRDSTNGLYKHYYQSGVQFTNLNHYGTLKMK